MSNTLLHRSLAFLCVSLVALCSHAQELTVVAGRSDTAHTGVITQIREATHFTKGELIELQFRIEAGIDSISKFEEKKFKVVSGPVRGRRDTWENEAHTHLEWRAYQVKARKRGVLVVPPMTVYSGGVAYRSKPLELVVGR